MKCVLFKGKENLSESNKQIFLAVIGVHMIVLDIHNIKICLLIPLCRIFFEKLIVTQLVRQ